MVVKFQLWHRQNDETEESYQLFQLYLRERNVSDVAKEYFGERGPAGIEAGRVYIQKLKREKRWEARCIAYDRWVAKQKDDAVGEEIQQEIGLIKRQRISMLRELQKKMKWAMKLAIISSDQDLYKLNTLLEMATKMDSLWRKFEESNPVSAAAENPFQKEMEGAQARLNEFFDQKMKKMMPTLQVDSSNTDKEVIQ